MRNFIKAFRLTIVMCVFLSLGYILVLWIFAKVAGPGNGNAEVVELTNEREESRACSSYPERGGGRRSQNLRRKMPKRG